MTCAACVNQVERALRKVPGWRRRRSTLRRKRQPFRWTPRFANLTPLHWCRLCRDAGYEAHLQSQDAPLEESSQTWWEVRGVTLGLVASVPMVLPMLWGVTISGLPGFSLCWLRAGAVRAGLALLQGVGRRSKTVVATWISWWPWAPRRHGVYRFGCGGAMVVAGETVAWSGARRLMPSRRCISSPPRW